MAAWLVAAVLGAGSIALAVLYSQVFLHRSRARLTPSGSFVEADGVRVHYVRRGQGPVVLFLHGLAGFVEDLTWSPLPEALEEDFTLVALDRPGYGHSTRPGSEICDVRAQADWLVAFLDELELEDPLVVGHSLGGGLALALALRHPDRVGGLVLLAPYAYPRSEPDAWFHGLPRLLGLRTAVGQTLAPAVSRLLGRRVVGAGFAPQPIPDDYHALWFDKVHQPHHLDTIVEEIRRIDPALASLAPSYPEIRTPTVVLSGTEDRSVDPEANAGRLAEAVPGVELELFEGVGHMVAWVEPEATVDAIEHLHERTAESTP